MELIHQTQNFLSTNKDILLHADTRRTKKYVNDVNDVRT